MRRVLTPGPRPFIAFGILLGAIGLLLVSVGIAHGRGIGSLKALAPLAGLYAALCAGLLRSRIVVTDDAIGYRPPFGIVEKRIPFSDVAASVTSVLAEPEHPVTLRILTKPGRRGIELRLKPFRQTDVAWLLSLPGLKVDR
jgi:hypothetical protein